jgi:hypothetical protein
MRQASDDQLEEQHRPGEVTQIGKGGVPLTSSHAGGPPEDSGCECGCDNVSVRQRLRRGKVDGTRDPLVRDQPPARRIGGACPSLRA